MRTLGRGCFLALALCAGCLKPPDDGPGVGSPGLEPPSALDGGGHVPGVATGGTSAHETPRAGSGAGQPTVGPGSGAGGELGQAGQAGSTNIPPQSAAGAGGTQDAGVDSSGDAGEVLDEDAAFFVGLWVVEQPFHALYEATLYEFDAAFTLQARETTVAGAPPRDGYVTGTVATELGVICSFEGDWSVLLPRLLEVDSRCTDGQTRRVRMRFDGDPAAGLVPILERVGGESTGWAHRDFDWVWRKCASATDCPPFTP